MAPKTVLEKGGQKIRPLENLNNGILNLDSAAKHYQEIYDEIYTIQDIGEVGSNRVSNQIQGETTDAPFLLGLS